MGEEMNKRTCPHRVWLPMMGGYRYECARCQAVGIRRASGVIGPYGDKGRKLRDAQKQEAWGDWYRNRREAARAQREREGEA